MINLTPDDAETLEGRLVELDAKATPRPWSAILRNDQRGQPVPYYRNLVGIISLEESPDGRITVVAESEARTTPMRREADAQLIAEGRNAIPLLLDFIRASREREGLLCDLLRQRLCPSDAAMTTGQCIDTRRCSCSAGLFAALSQPEASK